MQLKVHEIRFIFYQIRQSCGPCTMNMHRDAEFLNASSLFMLITAIWVFGAQYNLPPAASYQHSMLYYG